jgi:acyl-coenzyme A synthetase/AMP-(fatty) acid ligase
MRSASGVAIGRLGQPAQRPQVLYEHPAVAEAAVIGLRHPALGAEVGPAVVLKPGADVTAEELRDHIKAQVAAYKYPRKVWIVNELPKGRPERSSNVRSFLRATRAREKSEVYALLLDGDNR